MEKTRNFVLEGIHKGQFISWFVTTQAANKFTVRLYDEKKTYFCKSKKSTSIDPPLAQGSATMEGDTLRLEITVEGSDTLEAWFSNQKILSATTAETVGEHFILSAEDQKKGDEDYNDVCIDITAWNSRG